MVGVRCYSTWAPETAITLAHFVISLRIMAPNTAGLLDAGWAPTAAKRPAMSGSARAAATASWSGPTIAAG